MRINRALKLIDLAKLIRIQNSSIAFMDRITKQNKEKNHNFCKNNEKEDKKGEKNNKNNNGNMNDNDYKDEDGDVTMTLDEQLIQLNQSTGSNEGIQQDMFDSNNNNKHKYEMLEDMEFDSNEEMLEDLEFDKNPVTILEEALEILKEAKKEGIDDSEIHLVWLYVDVLCVCAGLCMRFFGVCLVFICAQGMCCIWVLGFNDSVNFENMTLGFKLCLVKRVHSYFHRTKQNL